MHGTLATSVTFVTAYTRPVTTRPGKTLLEVTDLVEFHTRRESPSGVQRVIAETAPGLLAAGAQPVILDRIRGLLVALDTSETRDLLGPGVSAETRAQAAEAALVRARSAPEAPIDTQTVLLFPGAVWINDALMLAARRAHEQGARLVYYLYDLTPVFESGHTAAVNMLFERYLCLIAETGSRVPAISTSTRRDFERWCAGHGRRAPVGIATRLPNGLAPDDFDLTESPWPRPYALFVGTIESRKNHIVALDAWRELIERRGADRTPDLVCIGRLGWHADAFLREYVTSHGLDGKVSMLTANVPDDVLARFYAHADFTVYPSAYEGWGLPVSESIAFGTPVICADNSSLREAGGDAAIFIPTDDAGALAVTVEEMMLTPAERERALERLRTHRPALPTWDEVAAMLAAEVDAARSEEVTVAIPDIDLGREYCLSPLPAAPDGAHADVYLDYLTGEGASPLLRQPRDARDFEVTDAAVSGTFGSPQTWGLEVRPGSPVTFRFRRPTSEAVTILISTRSMPGRVIIEAAGPGGPLRQEVYLGSVIRLALGAGQLGTPAQTTFTVVDASDSIEGFLGIRSFVVLPSEDLRGQVLAMEAATQALRQELDFMTGTRSWRLTAPLRRWKGRGA